MTERQITMRLKRENDRAPAEARDNALADIALGVPRLDEWASAADFMESVAATLDLYGLARPDHYPEDWA